MPVESAASTHSSSRGSLATLLAGTAALLLSLGSAHAASTCETQAADKKLAGAAKTSFVKKCEKDMAGGGNACESKAADKKLHGAAKNSFVKKCEADAKGAKDSKEAKPKA